MLYISHTVLIAQQERPLIYTFKELVMAPSIDFGRSGPVVEWSARLKKGGHDGGEAPRGRVRSLAGIANVGPDLRPSQAPILHHDIKSTNQLGHTHRNSSVRPTASQLRNSVVNAVCNGDDNAALKLWIVLSKGWGAVYVDLTRFDRPAGVEADIGSPGGFPEPESSEL
jgi:hypothetical protein